MGSRTVVDETYEISFVELFQFVRRGFFPALLIALLLVLAAFFISRSAAPIYQAKATILVSSATQNDLNRFGVTLAMAPLIDVSAYEAAALSFPVIEDAWQAMGVTQPGELNIQEIRRDATVRTESDRSSSLLRFLFAMNRVNSLPTAPTPSPKPWCAGTKGEPPITCKK